MRTIGLEVKTATKDKAELEAHVEKLSTENEELKKQLAKFKKTSKDAAKSE